MPDMARDLAASSTLIKNTVTAYVLGMCLALIPMGMLADHVFPPAAADGAPPAAAGRPP